MAAYRMICINCDRCGARIDCDEFENKLEARRLAKQYKGMKVYRVQNGALWDFCKSCAEKYKANLAA